MKTVDTKFNTDYLELLLRTAQQKEEDPIQRIIQHSLGASCTVYGQSGKSQWTGSGFHLGEGIIVTANHVAAPEDAETPPQIAVTFDKKSIYACEVVVADHNIDAALLHCPEIVRHIPTVRLGDSNTAQVGDIVAAIGSPEGWHDTATVGRISNIHQSLGESAPSPAWNDIIFVDADILEGSSGGMIIGTDGLVYGSVMGITGPNAETQGTGERAICPSNKIRLLIKNSLH